MNDKPVHEKGWFGCVDNPVRDADWSVSYSVGPILVGCIRIDYLRDAVDRGQSTDAVPLTDLLLLYTLRRLRDYCVAEYILCWTFCDTVWNPLRIEGFGLRRGALQVCQAIEGAGTAVQSPGYTSPKRRLWEKSGRRITRWNCRQLRLEWRDSRG